MNPPALPTNRMLARSLRYTLFGLSAVGSALILTLWHYIRVMGVIYADFGARLPFAAQFALDFRHAYLVFGLVSVFIVHRVLFIRPSTHAAPIVACVLVTEAAILAVTVLALLAPMMRITDLISR